MTTGKTTLFNIITEALEEIGHKYIGMGFNASYNPNIQVCRYSIDPKRIYADSSFFYEISINEKETTAKFIHGPVHTFDFHNPSSIVLLQAASMQMPMWIAIRNAQKSICDVIGTGTAK